MEFLNGVMFKVIIYLLLTSAAFADNSGEHNDEESRTSSQPTTTRATTTLSTTTTARVNSTASTQRTTTQAYGNGNVNSTASTQRTTTQAYGNGNVNSTASTQRTTTQAYGNGNVNSTASTQRTTTQAYGNGNVNSTASTQRSTTQAYGNGNVTSTARSQTTTTPLEVSGCITSCYGKTDGNYPACQPDCQSGIFYSCVAGFRYTRDCPLGWYVDSNNNRYTQKMVYDPASDQCLLTSSYCPRNIVTSNVGSQTTPPYATVSGCITSCYGKTDGNYPACQPDCESGIFYSCVAGYRYTRDCPLGWYVDSNNNRYTQKMVYDPASDQCLLTSSYCPRNLGSQTTTHAPGSDCLGSCSGRSDGNYPAWRPECESGIYYKCVAGYRYTMDCPLGWYTDSNNNPYTQRMVYDPATDQCLLTSSYCPRNLNVQITTTRAPVTDCITSCFGKTDGNYPACQPDCQSGIYYSCVAGYRYTRDCPLGWYVDSNNNRFTQKMVYNPATDQCLETSPYCPRNLSSPTTTTHASVSVTSTSGAQITTTHAPVRDCIGSCFGKTDGNYPACQPDCQSGIYYSCVAGYRYTMDCPLGWYVDIYNNRYTRKMVYNPATDQCLETSPYCPRNP